jgi:hypothetical protein
MWFFCFKDNVGVATSRGRQQLAQVHKTVLKIPTNANNLSAIHLSGTSD